MLICFQTIGFVMTKTIFLLLSILFISGCIMDLDSIKKIDSDSENKSIQEKDPEEADYITVIRFKSDNEVPLTDSSKVKIVVYGYSLWVADVAATIIAEKTFLIPSLDSTFNVEFNRSDFQKVKEKVGEENEFGYYIKFKIDVNNDGLIDTADYRQNYDISDMKFMGEENRGTTKMDIAITSYTHDMPEIF